MKRLYYSIRAAWLDILAFNAQVRHHYASKRLTDAITELAHAKRGVEYTAKEMNRAKVAYQFACQKIDQIDRHRELGI